MTRVFILALLLASALIGCGKSIEPWTSTQKSEYQAACELRVSTSPSKTRYCTCLRAIGEGYEYSDFRATEFQRFGENASEYQSCLNILSGQ